MVEMKGFVTIATCKKANKKGLQPLISANPLCCWYAWQDSNLRPTD